MDVDNKKRELKSHGTFLLPLEFYDCNNRVYKDCYMHWHKEMEIIYVQQGQMHVRINDTVTDGKTGDFICVPPEQVHHIKSGEERLLFRSLVFDIKMLGGASGEFCQKEVAEPIATRQIEISSKISPGQKNYAQIKNAFFTLVECSREKPAFYQLKAKYLILQMFYEILGGGHYSRSRYSSNKASIAVKTVLDYIGNHYSEDITVKELAQQVHYNESYFMRTFKKYTGRTLVEYLTDFRLDKSKEFLLQDGCTIEAAAFRAGFSSTSYFTSKFREAFRITPSEFRKLYNKEEMQ